MPHKIEDLRRAGWARARQHALYRRTNPSPQEKRVQALVIRLDLHYLAEFEITHDDGMPQWIDIFVPECNLAIEVDGSHGWHNYNGDPDKNLKMARYDELKMKWCDEHHIQFLYVNGRATDDQITQTIRRAQAQALHLDQGTFVSGIGTNQPTYS